MLLNFKLYLPLRAFLRLINTTTSQLDRIPGVKIKIKYVQGKL